MQTIVKSAKESVIIDTDGQMVIIGEKINPTGRKKMAAALEDGDFEYLKNLAISQVETGADILDINVGVAGMDEVTMMAKVVQMVSSWVDVPLCIDSPNPAVIKAGLEAATGKPLVNSVSGEKDRMQSILPLVKEHKAAVIGLTMDDSGIPSSAEDRLKIAEVIVENAVKAGIPVEDVVIDPLVMTVGSDSNAGVVTLQTIHLVREKLGVNINLGASNVSFGIPDRHTVNQAFLAIAMDKGASCAITDPVKLTSIIRAADLILGRDEFAMRYIQHFRKSQATTG